MKVVCTQPYPNLTKVEMLLPIENTDTILNTFQPRKNTKCTNFITLYSCMINKIAAMLIVSTTKTTKSIKRLLPNATDNNKTSYTGKDSTLTTNIS